MPIIYGETIVTAKRKIIKSFEPTFRNLDSIIDLRFWVSTQSKDVSGNWTDDIDSLKRVNDKIELGNNVFVDPLTGLIVTAFEYDPVTGGKITTGLIGSYDYLVSRTPAQIGITSLNTDIVFMKIVEQFEAFIELNHLHPL